MGKVYDALQRAEAERQRRAGAPAPGQRPPPTRAAAAAESFAAALPSAPAGRGAPSPAAADSDRQRIALSEPDCFAVEQFRTLRARLDALDAEAPRRTLAVTSALAGEGKTLAAVNLALVEAMHVGRRILLVDCDLRRPTVHAALGLAAAPGLGELLTGRVAIDAVLREVPGAHLDVLAGHDPVAGPAELLASPQMRALVAELARRYDRVILDTPATLAVPDAKTVADLCDGLVFVVRAGNTSREDVEAALELLGRERVLGLVLNGAHVDTGRYGYGSAGRTHPASARGEER